MALQIAFGGVAQTELHPKQRELRDLTHYRRKLIQSIAANKSRIDRVLEDCNVKLSSVMDGTSGVVAKKIIDRLIDGRQITMADIDEVYHRRLKASKEELLEVSAGYITEHHVYMLQFIRRDTAVTETIIADIDSKVKHIKITCLSYLRRFGFW